MKKFLSLMLALLMVFSMTACGGDSDNRDDNDDNDDNGGILGGSSHGSQKATIEETVLVDEAGIKITAKELDNDALMGTELKLLIENNTEQDLTVQARDSSVNGYMVENMMSVEVAAGKKANDSLTFLSSDLEACGIEAIADMEFYFTIFTSEDWKDYLDTEMIQIKTSLAETYEYTYDSEGTVLYEGDGIKLVSKGIQEDEFMGPSLLVYIHNETDQSITVQTRDTSVNGFMIDALCSQTVLPGKHAITSVTFLSSDLEENDIAEITEVEMSFTVFDGETWDDIVKTDNISLSF